MAKNPRNPNWGGWRPNSGRPASGIDKRKVSVSVEGAAWSKAMEMWGGKASHLIDKLLKDYVDKKAKRK